MTNNNITHDYSKIHQLYIRTDLINNYYISLKEHQCHLAMIDSDTFETFHAVRNELEIIKLICLLLFHD